MTTQENIRYKVMMNFNQDLIKDTETFKKITQSPVIEVENDLYKINLFTHPDTLINVNCTNIQTSVYSSSRADYYEYGQGQSTSNGKEITAKCHSIAKKIQDDIIREAKEIYKNKSYDS
jgi:hypothetical protein